MVHLSDYDPADPPYRPGDRVRLRPAADWRVADDGERPVHCVFGQAGGPQVGIAWPAELDALAGSEVRLGELAVSPRLPTLPAAGGGYYLLHPDWLAPPPDPAGPPCVCDDRHLFYRGCTCGRMARERGAAP